jgi:PhnB protein
MTKVEPYLAFNGDAREAMEFYQRVLGGTLDVQTFGETPMESPPEAKDRVMHARLESGDLIMMASDSPPDQPVSMGTNVSLSLQGTDLDGLTKAFDALGEGGNVTMPMEAQFWGDTFGMLTDRFGVHWMVNVAKE